MAKRPRELISGRYRGRNDRMEIELRVDVDGPRPTHRVSADYYAVPDGESLGSMRIPAAVVTVSATLVTISGRAEFTYETPHRQITIKIPLVPGGQARAPAEVRQRGPLDRVPTRYICAYESVWFRTVALEEAIQSGITRFDCYDTGRLDSDGPARTLSPASAFAEAGIEMRCTEPPKLIDTVGAGADGSWSDAELHAAMEAHFTRYGDSPQWAIWLMHAGHHDASGSGSEVQGLMFDRRGAQRQGCAVFYDAMPGSDPDSLRRQLHTCVHELAHGFNLLHCWQRSTGRPPMASRPDAATWMNYPERFPGGDGAFWRAFGFQFDDHELAHLRHAFREDAIMGGAPLGASGPVRDLPAWGDPRSRDAGGSLKLEMKVPRVLEFGAPVTVDLELSCTTRAGRNVHTVLGPRSSTVDIAISRTGGEAIVFDPLLRHCRGQETRLLQAGDRPVRDSAFVHYGPNGYPFAEPGLYKMQARYTSVDGTYVYSRLVPLRVARPRSAAEHKVGEIMYADSQVGVLMSVLGSDSDQLKSGTDALEDLVERYPAHQATSVARLVLGANAAREFKRVTTAGDVRVRKPDLPRARALVAPVLDIERLEGVAAAARAAATHYRGFAAVPGPMQTRSGVGATVNAFVRSRIAELTVEVPTIATRPPPGAVASPPFRLPRYDGRSESERPTNATDVRQRPRSSTT